MDEVLILKSCGFESNVKSMQLISLSFDSTVKTLQLSSIGIGVEKAAPAKILIKTNYV